MKNFIAIVSTIALILVICFAGYINFTNMSEHDHNIQNNDHNEEVVMGEPFKHKEHTHEHAGLACCPCGVCHVNLPKKDDEDKENEEHDHKHESLDIPILIRIICALTLVAVIFAALHI